MCLYYIYNIFGMFPLAMWIDPCHGIARPYLVWENYIQFRVKTWVTYFPLKQGSMHASVSSVLMPMNWGLIIVWTMHMSNNGNMSLLIQRGHIQFWCGKRCTHTNEAVVSLDHDRVSDLVKQGTCSLINEIWVSFHMYIQVSNSWLNV